ncbi:FtsL-like putative cell division protein [Lunatimonas salinarum]|uniref:FtsL-like putative cell division protein n=1 Tax=Lunatimonas salinarum TaxID=1774590 RepID=UPI001ADFF9C8|nr:FtsL-like putative cell division protein [Lunatimonas salinarum]
MAGNTFKQKMKGNSGAATPRGRYNLFAFIERKLALTGIFGEGIPVGLVPPFLYAALLALIYIWSNHKAENTIRKIEALQQEVEDIRADVTTLEAAFMYASKQSEVAKKIAPMGIEEIDKPPFKIIVEK